MKNTTSLESIREAFNPFSMHMGAPAGEGVPLTFMYIEPYYQERKKYEYVFDAIIEQNLTYKRAEADYYEQYRQKHLQGQVDPIRHFKCWVCGHHDKSLIMVNAMKFLCESCNDFMSRTFPTT